MGGNDEGRLTHETLASQPGEPSRREFETSCLSS